MFIPSLHVLIFLLKHIIVRFPGQAVGVRFSGQASSAAVVAPAEVVKKVFFFSLCQ